MQEKFKIRDKASVSVIRATDKHIQAVKCPKCGKQREYVIRCEHCGHVRD